MIAKRLETLIANEFRNTDIARRTDAEMVQRFQRLRGFGMLPKSRGKNAESLSNREIVAGILSIVTVKPGFAGVAAKTLINLRPVGDTQASFRNAKTFGEALAAILGNSDTLEDLVEVRASDSEIFKNGHGRGIIVYRDGEEEKTAYYVGQTALTLMQPGAEKTFDPRSLISTMISEFLFLPRFFRKIANELQREKCTAHRCRRVQFPNHNSSV